MQFQNMIPSLSTGKIKLNESRNGSHTFFKFSGYFCILYKIINKENNRQLCNFSQDFLACKGMPEHLDIWDMASLCLGQKPFNTKEGNTEDVCQNLLGASRCKSSFIGYIQVGNKTLKLIYTRCAHVCDILSTCQRGCRLV